MSLLNELNEIVVIQTIAMSNLYENSDEENDMEDVHGDDLGENEGYGRYQVSFERYDEFLATLEKINKNAKKYGVPPLTIKSKEKYVVPADKNNKHSRERHAWNITVEGEPVRMNGWEFEASLEHGPNGNVIRFVPGTFDERVKDYATASHRNCDFCHSNRDRNNTYIVRNIESNELKQVGGQCLQKYIGDNARKLARFSFGLGEALTDMIDYDDDGSGHDEGGGRRGRYVLDVETVLATAIVVTDKYGFVKSSSDYGMPTVQIVSNILYGNIDKYFREEYAAIIDRAGTLTADDKKRAKAIVDWFHALPETDKDSSYMVSLESIINADMVSTRSMGLMVSLPAVYHRAMNRNDQKQKETQKPSNHMGVEGGKIPPTDVTAVMAKYYEGAYGQYQMVKFKDDSGNMYTWFNTSKTEIEEGKTYKIVGTVKKHDEYNGSKQTVLTRVKSV